MRTPQQLRTLRLVLGDQMENRPLQNIKSALEYLIVWLITFFSAVGIISTGLILAGIWRLPWM